MRLIHRTAAPGAAFAAAVRGWPPCRRSPRHAAAATQMEAPPTVSVEPDPQGASGVIHAQVDINAPPQVVWAVMVDCARVPKLMVNVKYCHVLQRDPAGRWDLREQVTKSSLLPGVRTVMHSDYDAPHTVEFHRTDGDFKVLDGEWRLEPLDGGARTRVIYESRMSTATDDRLLLARWCLIVLRRSVEDVRHAANAEQSRRGGE